MRLSPGERGGPLGAGEEEAEGGGGGGGGVEEDSRAWSKSWSSWSGS